MNLKIMNYVGRHSAARLGRGFQTRPLSILIHIYVQDDFFLQNSIDHNGASQQMKKGRVVNFKINENHRYRNCIFKAQPALGITLFQWMDLPQDPGGGGTLILSCIPRLGSFFWVPNFEFQYFWGFSEK